MLIAIGSPLPDYRIKASTSSLTPSNRIHDDEYARRCGYRGALVPGASIYAYIARSLAELLGREWLERGSAEVRFTLPAYEGEEIRISGEIRSMTAEGILCIDCRAMNPGGEICATGTATLPRDSIACPPELENYPAGKHRPRRTISLQSLKVGELLNPVRSEFTRQTHWAYCQKIIRDHHPLFQNLIHPGWLLSQTGNILAENYDLAAWLHIGSTVRHYGAQSDECIVETRGRVSDKFELKGNHYLVLDLALFAGERCLQTILHTVIFRIAPRAA